MNTISEKTEECIELKNIKYKTMLLSGNVINETKTSNDMNNLDNFLENDKINNQNEPWSKLDKTIKTKKLILYADNYSKEHCFDEEEKTNLIKFFKDCLDRKKLQRVKDVIYDKKTGEIKEIPALFYNKSINHFTLKNIDSKRVSTLKNLPPKKATETQVK